MAWGAQHDPSSEDLGEIKRNNFDSDRGLYVYQESHYYLAIRVSCAAKNGDFSFPNIALSDILHATCKNIGFNPSNGQLRFFSVIVFFNRLHIKNRSLILMVKSIFISFSVKYAVESVFRVVS